MIADQDVHPEIQAYFLGAKLLRIIAENFEREVNPFLVYELLSGEEESSYHSFSMAMDWLFIIGALDLQGQEVVRCF